MPVFLTQELQLKSVIPGVYVRRLSYPWAAAFLMCPPHALGCIIAIAEIIGCNISLLRVEMLTLSFFRGLRTL